MQLKSYYTGKTYVAEISQENSMLHGIRPFVKCKANPLLTGSDCNYNNNYLFKLSNMVSPLKLDAKFIPSSLLVQMGLISFINAVITAIHGLPV